LKFEPTDSDEGTFVPRSERFLQILVPSGRSRRYRLSTGPSPTILPYFPQIMASVAVRCLHPQGIDHAIDHESATDILLGPLLRQEKPGRKIAAFKK
jgi:hypothetical protein